MEKQGLAFKYEVYEMSTGDVVEDCFVLRPQKDKAAREAMFAYAYATDNKELAADIFCWLESIK